MIAFRAQPIRKVRKPLAVAYGTAELPELVRQIRDFHVLRSVSVGAWVSIPDADHFRALKALRQPGGSLLRRADDAVKAEAQPHVWLSRQIGADGASPPTAHRVRLGDR